MVNVPYPDNDDESIYYYDFKRSDHSANTRKKINIQQDNDFYTEIISKNNYSSSSLPTKRKNRKIVRHTRHDELKSVESNNIRFFMSIIMIICVSWILLSILSRLEEIILIFFG